MPSLIVATQDEVLAVDAAAGLMERSPGWKGTAPTCLAADPRRPGRAWCGTKDAGVLRTGDGGRSWEPVGLEGERIMSVTASPARPDLVWVGTEPSAVHRSADGGDTWEATADMETLPSSSEWAFPPRPDTHHVRWIACHPGDPDRLWVAVEAGALVRTLDGGASWRDRVPGGPRDTHEAAVHPDRPRTLRVAAGDGYFESPDGGDTWTTPRDGLEVGYLRSVALDPGDPDTLVVSAASRAKAAYAAGHSDGRVYRRTAGGPWTRVREGWPEEPSTIAPLLVAGRSPGEMWAADERGVHRSSDAGRRWERVAAFPVAVDHLRGLAVLSAPADVGGGPR